MTSVIDKKLVYDFKLTEAIKLHSKEMGRAYYGFLQAYFNE